MFEISNITSIDSIDDGIDCTPFGSDSPTPYPTEIATSYSSAASKVPPISDSSEPDSSLIRQLSAKFGSTIHE